MNEGSNFCKYCGTKTVNKEAKEKAGGEVTSFSSDLAMNSKMENLIGNNAVYYLNEFERLKNSGISRFNWAVFFGGPVIPLYRKCFDFFIKRYLPYIVTSMIITIFRIFAYPMLQNTSTLQMLYIILQFSIFIWGISIYIISAKHFNSYYYDRLKKITYSFSPEYENNKNSGTTHKYYIVYLVCISFFIFSILLCSNMLENVTFGVWGSDVEPELSKKADESIDWTTKRLINELDLSLAEKSLPKYSDLPSSPVEDSTSKQNNDTCLGYFKNDAVHAYFYDSNNTGKLSEAMFMLDITTTNTEDTFFFINSLMTCIHLFDPKKYDTIINTLSLDQVQVDDSRIAYGDSMDYFFVIKGSKIACMIVPHKSSSNSMTAENIGSIPEENPNVSQITAPALKSAEQDIPGKKTQTSTPVESSPVFKGYLCRGSSMDTPASEFHASDQIYLDGQISGISGLQEILIEWILPNGQIIQRSWYLENNDNNNTGYSGSDFGYGSGSVTVTLKSTGEVLATYYFTVIE